jgi:hypothetical protein
LRMQRAGAAMLTGRVPGNTLHEEYCQREHPFVQPPTAAATTSTSFHTA